MFGQLTARARLTLGVLAAVLLLAAGVSVGYLIPTLRAPGEDSVDAGFARDMSVHHAQAVEMGMFAYRLGTTDDIRNLGYPSYVDYNVGAAYDFGNGLSLAGAVQGANHKNSYLLVTQPGIDLGFGPVGQQTWSPNTARFIVTLTKTL